MSDRGHCPASLVIVAALVLACSGPVATPTTVPVETPNATSAESVAPIEPTPSAPPITSPGSPEPSAALPVIQANWAQTELTDVATGEAFRIADLAGRVVIIETMAIWCVNCRAQQGEVYAALEELDPARFAYVLLDVDPNETGPALAEYRSRNGFTGTYAIAGDEVARALAADFGDQVLNPPSTPMILIGADGTVTLTDFGHKPAAAVVQLARDHGA